MKYSISQLSKLAGVSSRTLRYYEEIGLLLPREKGENGYRYYSSQQVDKLQQIMFYRSFDMELDDIKNILNSDEFDPVTALESHLVKLENQKAKINRLIDNVNKTILSLKGETTMSDKEKFAAFKQNIVDKNEEKYGAEARRKYGDKAVDDTNKKILDMSLDNWNSLEELNELLNKTLKIAVEKGDPASETAQKACALHKEWLGYYWNFYNKEAHLNLCLMYTQDERFKEYYEKIAPGCADFLYEAMKIYLA
ncbi:MAG: MerR family transcriptional regulator [Oscillospiraceae bacterium]|nr:MerR family transcriptional regulator [Oscillospiraceae bacterium]MBR6609304.1 MerR family transcriptional regulator [Oscillospiraceae bacterium]